MVNKSSERKSRDLTNVHVKQLNKEKKKALRTLTRHVRNNWEIVYSKLPGNLTDGDFDQGDMADFTRNPKISKTRLALRTAGVVKIDAVNALVDLFSSGRAKQNNWAMPAEERRGLAEEIYDYMSSFKMRRRPSSKK